MITTKRKTGKFLVFAFIALLAFIGASFFATSQSVTAYAAESSRKIGYARHIPTIEDDFADNRVIVTLKRGYSDVNSRIDVHSFETAGIISSQNAAVDSFSSDTKNTDKPIIEAITDLTRMENPSAIIKRDSFSQILSLQLRVNSKEGVLKAIQELEQLDHVLAAEPDYNIIAEDLWFPSTENPNDTRFGEQWALGAAPGAQIVGVNGAWSISTGQATPRIRVGIFETGVQANHPDLRVIAGNLTSGVEDHGTHVGGIIGAIADNDRGIAGIAQVEIVLLDRGGGGLLTTTPDNTGVFAESLTWALDNNIRIVNCSFRFLMGGTIMRTPIVAHREAIVNFGENGGLLVAAAANDALLGTGNLDVNA